MKKLAAILLFLFLCPSIKAQENPGQPNFDIEQIRKLQMAQMAITALYVDSVDQKKLVEDAINGILKKLDPHSAYSDPETTKKMNEPLEGNFEGIGIQFNILEDTLVVIQTISKGPSEKVGILAGDRIVSVDGAPIAGVKMSRDSIMKKLRGPKDTKVNLSVVRREVKDTLLFCVTRDKIPLNTLDAGYMIAPEIGYIHLDRFGATSGNEVHEMLKKLKKEGMKDLILDLTINGGGYLGAAIDVANEFLEEGELIVYTEGRAAPRSTYKAKGGGIFREGRVVVLVDEYSASAAEIVSGAIQDQDRGTIIGRRTFGKGLVQRPIELIDGSMIRLTVSHYYTPAGRCIQKPYEKGKKEEYDKDLETRFNHGELTSIDSIHLDSTKVYKTLKKNRPVYGGGGIMPDLFVPLDTTIYTPCFRAIRRYNLANNASLKFVDRHRNGIKKEYPDFEKFMQHYEVPAALTDSILAEAKRKKVEAKDSVEAAQTLDQLRFTLKALIAYDIWERSEYFRIINTRSDIVKKALEVLAEGRKNKKKICRNKKSL